MNSLAETPGPCVYQNQMGSLMARVGADLLGTQLTEGVSLLVSGNSAGLVDALLEIVQGDPEGDDRDLQIQAAILLARGGELVPLPLVVDKLYPILTSDNPNARRAASIILEMAAPTPGNEALQGEPSPPVESLGRIIDQFPDPSNCGVRGEVEGRDDHLELHARDNRVSIFMRLRGRRTRQQDHLGVDFVTGYAEPPAITIREQPDPLEPGPRSNRQHTTHARNDFGLPPNILRDVLARVRRLS